MGIGFPEWKKVMDNWAHLLSSSLTILIEMLEIGLGLPKSTLTDYIKDGQHLLAPTGSNLSKYGELNFHYESSFMTIHGRSRYPGLNIWLNNGGCKIPVKVPEGCLLVQSGKQLEWLTGGVIKAGYHKVIVIKKARSNGRCLWRISSTMFYHCKIDKTLTVLLDSNKKVKDKYPDASVADYTKAELGGINLSNN